MDTSLYYSPDQLLTYNRTLNFTVGARGIGKTFSWKRRSVKKFIEHGHMFVYVRRYKTELKKIGTFFDDIREHFPDHTFVVKGWKFFIDGKLCGYAIPLSTYQNEKSASYPDVKTIFFDEFIREATGGVGYLKDEVNSFMNLCDTIIRTRSDVKIICLSNAVTVINPYFVYFKLYPDTTKRFNKFENIMIEIPDSVDFSEERKKTPFGRLISDTEYADMSLDNKFTKDSDVFITKRPPHARFKFSVVYKGRTMGIWYDPVEDVLHLSEAHDPNTKSIYILSKDDMKENMTLTMNWKTTYHLRKMVNAFTMGLLRFDNQLVRTEGYDMFKKMNIFN